MGVYTCLQLSIVVIPNLQCSKLSRPAGDRLTAHTCARNETEMKILSTSNFLGSRWKGPLVWDLECCVARNGPHTLACFKMLVQVFPRGLDMFGRFAILLCYTSRRLRYWCDCAMGKMSHRMSQPCRHAKELLGPAWSATWRTPCDLGGSQRRKRSERGWSSWSSWSCFNMFQYVSSIWCLICLNLVEIEQVWGLSETEFLAKTDCAGFGKLEAHVAHEANAWCDLKMDHLRWNFSSWIRKFHHFKYVQNVRNVQVVPLKSLTKMSQNESASINYSHKTFATYFWHSAMFPMNLMSSSRQARVQTEELTSRLQRMEDAHLGDGKWREEANVGTVGRWWENMGDVVSRCFKRAQLQILVSQSWTWHFDAFGCTLQDQKPMCPVGPATLGSIKMGLHNAQHPAKQRKNSTVCINESNYKV